VRSSVGSPGLGKLDQRNGRDHPLIELVEIP